MEQTRLELNNRFKLTNDHSFTGRKTESRGTKSPFLLFIPIYLSLLFERGNVRRAICFYSRAPPNKLDGQTVGAVEVSIFRSTRVLLFNSFEECLHDLVRVR